MERIIIPTEWIEAAVDFRIPATGQKIIALDVADEGGDENAEIWRHGVVIPPGAIEHWSEGDTGATTRRVCFTCKQNNIKLFKYDNIGVGAGVKAEINNWNANPERKIDKFKIIPQGINFGASPTPGNFAPGKPNKEMFQNLKAQLWWECRRRFERTWKVKNRKAKYSSEQLCSIPNHPQLKLELAQPRYEFNENTGKLRVEKKEKMKGRGIASPNVADAFVVCFSRPIGLDLLLLTET